MQALVEHLLRSICSHPDAIQVQMVEGESVTVLEVVLHPEDRERLDADGGRTLRAVRTVVSAAAGRTKATLDLVDALGAPTAAAEE
jgi:predicted RNA-binding protein YlqC (UPF0109 family)